MAVKLTIKELALDDQIDHLATDWEVSTTVAFNNVVLRSLADYTNKRSIMFDAVLNPNVKYYARARALLSTGYTTWGNLDVFIPTSINDLSETGDIPTRISAPILTTDSITTGHSNTMFNIFAAGFSVVGGADHNATSWFIEDLEGNVIWKRVREEIYKTSILVNDILLEDNKIYRIKAMFHSTSNDVSQISTLTIHVVGDTDIELVSFLDNVDVSVSNTLVVSNIDNVTEFTWEVIFYNNGLTELVWSDVSATNEIILPDSTLAFGNVYLLRIKTNVKNIWKYYIFTTTSSEYNEGSTELENQLVVNAGTTKTVFNLYDYTSVVVKGTSEADTGILIWEYMGTTYTFNYLDLIVTRDMVVSRVAYEAKQWRSVLVLDGAKLILEETPVFELPNPLVVNIATNVVIDNLYDYTSVVINGTSDADSGTLSWTYMGSTYVFNYLDFIVTRDLNINRSVFAAKPWRSILVLDGANFTINENA